LINPDFSIQSPKLETAWGFFCAKNIEPSTPNRQWIWMRHFVGGARPFPPAAATFKRSPAFFGLPPAGRSGPLNRSAELKQQGRCPAPEACLCFFEEG
jgi:hypothetical protein